MAGFAGILISVLEMCRGRDDLEDLVRGLDSLSQCLVIGCILLIVVFCFREKHFLISFSIFYNAPIWGTLILYLLRVGQIPAA